MTVTLRQETASGATTKGSALTYAELDNNFVHLLRQGTVSVAGDSGTQQTLGEADRDSTLIIKGGTNISTAVSAPDSAGSTTLTITNDMAAGLANIVEDTTPQLGGALDAQGQVISNPIIKDYAETVEALGSTDSPTLTVANGNVKTVTISSALNLPAFADAAAGQTVTLVVSGSGTAAASGGASYKFAGGNKTLTNDSIVSIHTPDGTNYFASIATNFTA
tara:strand:- start:3718 stop:4380 length:663 start_codon:yes stop_codon:yes gene_type:complete